MGQVMGVKVSDRKEYIISKTGVLLGPEGIMCHLRRKRNRRRRSVRKSETLDKPLSFPTLPREPS